MPVLINYLNLGTDGSNCVAHNIYMFVYILIVDLFRWHECTVFFGCQCLFSSVKVLL